MVIHGWFMVTRMVHILSGIWKAGGVILLFFVFFLQCVSVVVLFLFCIVVFCFCFALFLMCVCTPYGVHTLYVA